MFYTVYKTTNKLNGKFYIGAHKTKNINDDYLGSGVALKRAIEKYGIDNFHKEIIGVCETSEEMYLLEKSLIDHKNEMSYNMKEGGKGGWDFYNEENESPLRNPKVRDKLVKTRKANGSYQSEKFLSSCVENIKKATAANTGVKKPKHSEFMKKRNSRKWRLTDPNGRKYEVENLKEFCYNRQLPYSSIAAKKKIGIKQKCGWVCHGII